MNKSKKPLFDDNDLDDFLPLISNKHLKDIFDDDDDLFYVQSYDEMGDIILSPKNKKGPYHDLMALSDGDILSRLRTHTFWERGGKNDTCSVIVSLCQHPDAFKSLRFLSCQTGNFSWGDQQMASLGRVLEKMDKERRRGVFDQLFHEQSTINIKEMFKVLIDFDLGDNWDHQKNKKQTRYAIQTSGMLFDCILSQNQAKDIFSDTLPQSVHGMWVVCEQMTKHGRDIFSFDQDEFNSTIVSFAFLNENNRKFEQSQAWFLKAWDEVPNKGEYVFDLCDGVRRQGERMHGLDEVLKLMDDSDVALFVEKSMTQLNPSLGARAGSMLQRGVLTKEVSVQARKKM